MPTQFPAKFPGRCQACGETIAAGEMIRWGTQHKKVLHATCTESPDIGRTEVKRLTDERATPEQIAAFNEALEGTGSIMLEAVAGSGKTTVLEETARRLLDARTGIRLGYGVFNKRNAVEAQERMPAGMFVGTLNGIGWGAVRRALPSIRLNTKGGKYGKCGLILESLYRTRRMTKREYKDLDSAVLKLVSLAKSHAVGSLPDFPDTPDTWHWLASHYNIDFSTRSDNGYAANLAERGIEIAHEAFAISRETTDEADFDDQVYLPVALNLPVDRFDIFCADEVQDTNPVQQAMIAMLLGGTGRLMAVGDRRQAIYGFRGASHDAMDRIEKRFGCKKMGLTVNFRCGKTIIEVAQQFGPEIQAWEGSPDGEVYDLTDFDATNFEPTDAILCRNNAPLVTLYYKLIPRKIRARILGRDLGSDLGKLVEKLVGDDIILADNLADLAEAFKNKEIRRWLAKGEDGKAQAVEDKVDSLIAVCDAMSESATSADVLAHLNEMFTDKADEPMLTLTSVHKAKGLEWNRVFILDPWRMPSSYAKQAWEVEQENNIQYVAWTRAKLIAATVSLDSIH